MLLSPGAFTVDSARALDERGTLIGENLPAAQGLKRLPSRPRSGAENFTLYDRRYPVASESVMALRRHHHHLVGVSWVIAPYNDDCPRAPDERGT